MSWLQNLPIRRKITLVILLTCGAALVLACAALAAYEWYDFRRTLVRDTTVLADIIGSNVRADLSFDDQKGARETLSAMALEPNIAAARLFRQNGEPFVDFARPQFL